MKIRVTYRNKIDKIIDVNEIELENILKQIIRIKRGEITRIYNDLDRGMQCGFNDVHFKKVKEEELAA